MHCYALDQWFPTFLACESLPKTCVYLRGLCYALDVNELLTVQPESDFSPIGQIDQIIKYFTN